MGPFFGGDPINWFLERGWKRVQNDDGVWFLIAPRSGHAIPESTLYTAKGGDVPNRVDHDVRVWFPDGVSEFRVGAHSIEDVKEKVETYIKRVMGSHDGCRYEVWIGENLLIGEAMVTESDRLIIDALGGE